MNKMVNGVLVEMTDAEIATANAERDDYINNLLPIDVRNQRDRLLAETDWMALSDVTMSNAWTAYRQALRDIPAQAGFPFSVTWPTKPEQNYERRKQSHSGRCRRNRHVCCVDVDGAGFCGFVHRDLGVDSYHRNRHRKSHNQKDTRSCLRQSYLLAL